MPGTRASPPESLQSARQRSPYTPMSSRDTFDSRQTLIKDPKARKSHQEDDEQDMSYPVPARLRRSSKKPKIKKQSQSVALSPITERYRSGSTASPITKHTLRTVDISPKPNAKSDGSLNPRLRTGQETTPCQIETPKPLFHSQQKLSYSIAPNTVPRMSGPGSTISGLYTQDVKDPIPRTLEGPRPRSKSLHIKKSALRPHHVPPPIPSHAPQISLLPWERAKDTLDKVKSQKGTKENRISEGSVMSDSTSILDHEKPRGFSQVLSIGIPSPATVEALDNKLETSEIRGIQWDPSSLQHQATSQQMTRAAITRPQMNSQKSFKAENRTDLPRSTSSSLSTNMSLNHSHISESTTDLSKLAMLPDVQTNVPKVESPDRNKSRRECFRSASLSRSNTFDIHDDSKNKRLSSPILHPTSGNPKSPISSPGSTVRSSIATETSYDWDLENPMPVAKGRISMHRRQNFAEIAMPNKSPQPFWRTTEVKQQEHQKEIILESNPPATTIKKETKSVANFRPPSTLLFDPQYAYTPDSQSPQIQRRSQSLGTITRSGDHSSPEQEQYTPTKKPSDRRRHHHRYKSIVAHPGMRVWPQISTTNSTFIHSAGLQDPLKSNIFRQSLQPDDSDLDSRPSTVSIPSFPTPPPKSPVRRLHQPNWRGPKTPIRHPMGPRAMLPSASRIPVRHHSPLRGSSRRPPTRNAGVTKAHGYSPSKSNSNSPSKMLANVSLLRRMNSEANSEVNVRGSKEHKRYQSIGEVFEEEAFGEGDVLGGGKENVRESLRRPKAMPLTGYVEKVSTESSRYNLFAEGEVVGSYDDKGFLKEGSTSGFDF